MARSLIDQLGDTIARRTHVPADLEAITLRGAETGDPAVIAPIWEGVEALYRTGMHPGIQVCIRHRGEVVLDRALGHARGNRPGHRFDPDLAVPMNLDTPVNLFSAAKAVSAMVMHKLEELGSLTLDDRVSEHVPGFDRHGKGDITIRQVLTHRSGVATLPEFAFDLDLLADHEQIEAMLCELEPESAPGGAPAYHAVIGGFVMETVTRRATGRSMRDVLATEIRDPLGLGWFDLGVDPDAVDQVAHNVETGFPLTGPLDVLLNRVLGTRWSHVL
ncbi:MAG: beta-lactamase family protein, partial [Acidimicrobiia bacterium]|nr:beta-lactamase family protein [Acidimicrobiia bacterium]